MALLANRKSGTDGSPPVRARKTIGIAHSRQTARLIWTAKAMFARSTLGGIDSTKDESFSVRMSR